VRVIDPDAWVIDDIGFVKDGTASPGVARQYSGTLGKVGNCQVGVSVCAVTDTASCPLSWRLFLPPGWEDTEAADEEAAAVIRARRARAGIQVDPGLLATNGTRAHGRTPCALRRRPPPQARRPSRWRR
jgi:SRSO17 transposase